ncbi:uncharacterized protein [Typha latifolia]|uniref:uncharacterized protein n=1 Tax=Typha latifolia TaxID=4733 RepID=UPI003C30BB40
MSLPSMENSGYPTRSRRHHRRRLPPSPSPSQSEDAADNGQRYQELTSLSSNAEPNYGDASLPSQSFSPSFYPSNSSHLSSTPPLIPPTYVNVAPLPVFRGDAGECPVAHLARFDRVCRANNAADPGVAARIFPASLDDDAALWYDLTVEPLGPSLAWPDVRFSFLCAFRRPDFADRARSELMSLSQGDAETVNRYHLRMQWVLKRWPEHGIPDGLLKGIFIDGLREDFQDWVIPQQPQTLADAVRLATSWEQAEGARDARRRGKEARCAFCGAGGHVEGACDVRRRMKDLWARSSREGVGGGRAAAVLTPSGSLVRREEDQEEKDQGSAGRILGSFRRKGQCQCWKHQCWKKLERSTSSATGVLDGNQGDCCN